MVKLFALFLALTVTAPAFAQAPPVVVHYTNADLEKPIMKPRLVVTPEVWASLVARQFTYTPPSHIDYPAPRPLESARDVPPQVVLVTVPEAPIYADRYLYRGLRWTRGPDGALQAEHRVRRSDDRPAPTPRSVVTPPPVRPASVATAGAPAR